ncbi:MAG: S-layer homology domain-containing protein, partial [Lysinibacillus sp.]
MKKYSRKLIVSTLLASAVTAGVVNVSANTYTFKDVPNANSHYDSIYNLVDRGIIKGYSDGTFRPDNTLTRGQAAKILAGILKLDTTDMTQLFTDVPAEYEHVAAINALFKKGIIGGYSDGTFRPNAILTRGQLAKILVKAFELKEAQDEQLPFTDIAPDSDLATYVQTLLNYSITQGTSATTFSPTNPVTRGQMASFVVRAENVAKTLKEKTAIRVSSDFSINTIEPIDLQINDTTTWPATVSSKDVEQANEVIITFEHDEQGKAFDISNLSDTITLSFEDSAYVISFEKGKWVLSIVPPQKIENVTAKGEQQKVKLTWDAVQDAKTYIIYRAETIDGQYMPIGEVAEHQFTDQDLVKGKTYYYKIASQNGRAESEIIKGTANVDRYGPLYSGDYVVISNESLAVEESQSAGTFTLHSRQAMKHEIVPLKETFAFADTNLSTNQVTSLYKVGDTKLFNLNNNA